MTFVYQIPLLVLAAITAGQAQNARHKPVAWPLPALNLLHNQHHEIPFPQKASLPPCLPSLPRIAAVAYPPFHREQLDDLLQMISHCRLGRYVAPNAFVIDCDQASALRAGFAMEEAGFIHRIICLPAERTIESEIENGGRERKFQTLNKFSRYVTQAGSKRDLPVFRHGLNGSGQLVAIADTGVDYDMCYFHDPHHPVPVDKVNLDHRKIVVYRVLPPGSSLSPDTSHGTHTAGSLAGEAWSSDPSLTQTMSLLNGMAFAAKLAVYDLGPKRTIRIPADLYKNLFEVIAKDTGSKISSNSWGAPLDQTEVHPYDQYALAVDKYVWDHQDFLVLFGAGNWGSSTSSATIGTPAIAKNALTIGSATSTAQSFKEAHLAPHVFMQILKPVNIQGVAGIHGIIQAKIGGDITELEPVERVAQLASPANACDPLPINYQNKLVMVLDSQGSCSAAQQAVNVQNANGSAMILISAGSGNEPIDEFPVRTALSHSVRIPIFGIDSELGMALISHPPESVMILVPAYDESLKEKRSLGYVSDFSSRGPTFDGRIKPDVLSPGEYILSAKSDLNLNSFQCDPTQYSSMKGTSMSTPIAAGNMAQIRQYLVDGYYPSGKPNPEDSISSPPAALLKALAINSGVKMHGWVSSSNEVITVDDTPSFIQGFGRMQLDRVLRLDADVDDFDLFLSYNREVHTSEHHHYCFNVDSMQRTFKATLVWTDPPADMDSDYLLVNNMDLVATSVRTGFHWVGNNKRALPASNSSLHTFIDSVNNVEQVEISLDTEDLIDILVIGSNIPHGPQPYALVVTGRFEHRPISECSLAASVCPNSCSNHGSCTSDGLCQCESGYSGFDCSYSSSAIHSLQHSMSGTVEVGQWIFFHFDVSGEAKDNDASQLRFDPSINCIQVTLSSELAHGGPHIFLSFNEMPFLGKSQWSNQSRTVPKTISLQGSPTLSIGRYYIGIWGSCCTTTSFTLSFSTQCTSSWRQSSFAGPWEAAVDNRWVYSVVVLVMGAIAALAAIIIRILIGTPNNYRPIDKSRPFSDGDEEEVIRINEGFSISNKESTVM